MRTALTLDDELAEKLKVKAARSGRSFKENVNNSIRLGLKAARAARELPPFKVRPKDLKPKPGVEFENVSALLEGPWHR